mmetsp:Transcript_67332/g.108450  ORF Transcript_67332/g.108450 Transcript_67332/m.108450 type:complete len:129 (+) Transcript_67332:1628-2014(+)
MLATSHAPQVRRKIIGLGHPTILVPLASTRLKRSSFAGVATVRSSTTRALCLLGGPLLLPAERALGLFAALARTFQKFRTALSLPGVARPNTANQSLQKKKRLFYGVANSLFALVQNSALLSGQHLQI